MNCKFTQKKLQIFERSLAFKIFSSKINSSRPLFNYILFHGSQVAIKALKGAQKVADQNPDYQFIFEASILHDIGIIYTYAPQIDCFGKEHYIKHGILGAELFRKFKLEKYARVCETHVGTGISLENIKKDNLDLPLRNYFPETLEEKLICWADKFFSKSNLLEKKEKTIPEISHELNKYGQKQTATFLKWNEIFAPA